MEIIMTEWSLTTLASLSVNWAKVFSDGPTHLLTTADATTATSPWRVTSVYIEPMNSGINTIGANLVIISTSKFRVIIKDEQKWWTDSFSLSPPRYSTNKLNCSFRWHSHGKLEISPTDIFFINWISSRTHIY